MRDDRIVHVQALMWAAFRGDGFAGDPPLVVAGSEAACRDALHGCGINTADVFYAEVPVHLAFDNHVDRRPASLDWLDAADDE